MPMLESLVVVCILSLSCFIGLQTPKKQTIFVDHRRDFPENFETEIVMLSVAIWTCLKACGKPVESLWNACGKPSKRRPNLCVLNFTERLNFRNDLEYINQYVHKMYSVKHQGFSLVVDSNQIFIKEILPIVTVD